jgi:hypothetical protein
MEGLFKGSWLRSAVKLEGGTIVPDPSFLEVYDPFDFYYPAGELRQGQRSLDLEILAVNSADTLGRFFIFVKKYGTLKCIENFELSNDPRPVQELSIRRPSGDEFLVVGRSRTITASFHLKPRSAVCFVAKVFKPALRKAGILEGRWHDLRHTAASRRVMAGVDLYAVKEILRHQNIATTMRYAHLSPGFLQEAVNRGSLVETVTKTVTKTVTSKEEGKKLGRVGTTECLESLSEL